MPLAPAPSRRLLLQGLLALGLAAGPARAETPPALPDASWLATATLWRDALAAGPAALRRLDPKGALAPLLALRSLNSRPEIWRRLAIGGLLLVGDGRSAEPVIALYAPIADAWLLSRWRRAADGRHLPVAVAAVDGPSLRTEAGIDALDANGHSAPWLLRALTRASCRAFAERHPALGQDVVAWPAAARPERLAELERALAVPAIALERMATTPADPSPARLAAVLRRGDASEIRALLRADPTDGAATIAALPPARRAGIEAIGLLAQAEGGLLLLSLGEGGRFMLLAEYRALGDGRHGITALLLLDLLALG